MRRDSIFYKLFQQSPTLLFQLLATPPTNAEAYRFDSVAVKEPKFEIDGVVLKSFVEGNLPHKLFAFCHQKIKVQELYISAKSNSK
jgi:predicted transposase YdaD